MKSLRGSVVRRIHRSWHRIASLPLTTAATTKSAPETQEYDIIVNGGGVVGLAFTALVNELTGGSLKIAIYGAPKPESITNLELSDPPHTRVYALSPSSIELLKSVRAWDSIQSRSQPYDTMQIWDANGPGLIKFRASEVGKSELGRIVEDDAIVKALLTVITTDKLHANTLLIQDAKLTHVNLPSATGGGNEAVVVRDNNKQQSTARLLIGADGAGSFVRTAAGLGTYGLSYGQLGVVGTVRLADAPSAGPTSSAQTMAWQRYLGEGPIALLPLWDGYASIVWSAPVQEAKRLTAMSDKEWIAAVNEALQSPRLGPPCSSSSFSSSSSSSSSSTSGVGTGAGDNLPPFLSDLWKGRGFDELRGLAMAAVDAARLLDPPLAPPLISGAVGPRLAFPLQLQQATGYVGPRLALAGDAAHSIHPQAGQGLNLGMQDASALATVVAESVRVGGDIGQEVWLKRYQRQRYSPNLAMISGVDLLHRLFEDNSEGLSGSGITAAKRVARTAGLLGLHALGGGLRSAIIRTASEGMFAGSQGPARQ